MESCVVEVAVIVPNLLSTEVLTYPSTATVECKKALGTRS
jgi:hypothetical protein